MLAILSIFATAHAGDLIVTTLTPVIVSVDGTAIDYIPGTMVAQVSGLSGVHKVEIATVTGQRVAQMNVSIPAEGGTGLAFDGANLAVASAGLTMSATVATAQAAAPAPAPAPQGPVAMGDGAFQQLLGAIDDASFSDDKLGVIRAAVGKNWLTIGQVGQIVDHLDFGGDKVAAVGACRARVVDPENAFQLSGHFDFSGDSQKALAFFD